MRRKRPYTEPDRIKERIQAVKDGDMFRKNMWTITEYQRVQAEDVAKHDKAERDRRQGLIL